MNVPYDVENNNLTFNAISESVVNTRKRAYDKFAEDVKRDVILKLPDTSKISTQRQNTVRSEVSRARNVIEAENTKVKNYLQKFAMDFETFIHRSNSVIQKFEDSIVILGKSYVGELEDIHQRDKNIVNLDNEIEIIQNKIKTDEIEYTNAIDKLNSAKVKIVGLMEVKKKQMEELMKSL